MSNRRPATSRVSDHALLSFLERAGGFEIEPLRAAIEDSLARAIIAAGKIGAADLVIRADGLRYVVKAGVVVTITEARRTSRQGSVRK
jgi:hypothetical protein